MSDVNESLGALKKASYHAVDCAGLLDRREGADNAPASASSHCETGDKIKKGVMSAAKVNNRARMAERMAQDAPLKPPISSANSNTPEESSSKNAAAGAGGGDTSTQPSPSPSAPAPAPAPAPVDEPASKSAERKSAQNSSHRRSGSGKKLGSRVQKHRLDESDSEDDAEKPQSTFASVAKSHLQNSFSKLSERIEKIH